MRGVRVGVRGVLALAVIASPALFAAAAGGVTNFSLSPTSGPPGTEVSVSGSGCVPGVLLHSVQIAATTVPLAATAQITPTPNGTWRATLTIPANAAAGPAAVTALCISDGALATVYSPQTFTVTSVTPTSPPTTAPPTTPTTNGSRPPTSHATTTTVATPRTTPGQPNTSTTQVPAAATPKGPTLGGNDGNGGRPGGGGTASAEHPERGGTTHHAGTQSRTATLDGPNLTLVDSQPAGSGGLGWLLWVLLVAALAAGAVWGAWWYRTRRHTETEPSDEPDLQSGMASTAGIRSQEHNALMQTFGDISGVDPIGGD